MYSYFRPSDVVDLAIITYSAYKRDPVPLADYSVPNVIGVFVTYAIEVVGLTAHVISFGIFELHNSSMQSQRRYRPTSNHLVQARSSLAL